MGSQCGPETLDSDKNVLSVGISCEQRNSFQSDWITSRVIRRLAAWYTDYCLNEIDQMFRRCVWLNVYTLQYQMGQRKGLENVQGSNEVALSENEIPKEA